MGNFSNLNSGGIPPPAYDRPEETLQILTPFQNPRQSWTTTDNNKTKIPSETANKEPGPIAAKGWGCLYPLLQWVVTAAEFSSGY